MKTLKVFVSIFSVIALICIGFLLGVISSATDPWIEALYKTGGGNILSPLAVFLSATIASLAAFFGLRENGRREKNKWTLDHLGYKRFTWSGIRTITPCLVEIKNNRVKMDDETFDAYMLNKRNVCTDLFKLISFLDSYQQLAFGIRNGLYDEHTAKLICQDKAIYLLNNSRDYVQWRRQSKLEGVANEHNVYLDFEKLAQRWQGENLIQLTI